VSRGRRFSGWRSLGGGVAGRAYPVVFPDGTIAAYVVGNNNLFHQALLTGRGEFRGWTTLGRPGVVRGVPFMPLTVTAAATGGGRVTVLATNGFDLVTRSSGNGRWGPWTVVDPPLDLVHQGGIAAASTAPGQLTLVWASQPPGLNPHLSTLAGGRWSRSINLGGTFPPGEFFASATGSRLDLWTKNDRGIFQRTSKAGHWGPWTLLPIG
jgi:hypothetical protein